MKLFDSNGLSKLEHIRNVLLRNMLTTIKQAQTGHLGACCSSLDLYTVLYFGGVLRYDTADARHPLRDYVLNRGHLGPLRYNIFSLIGWMKEEEMSTYRAYGSRLAGHEDMKLTPGVDITPNGSLGMTLSYGVGAAIGFKDKKMPNRVFCFLGDGEEEEGNIAEAARHAGHLKLPRLIVTIDRNGGQLSTRLPHTDSTDLHALWAAYGWHVIDLPQGHDLASIKKAYDEALVYAEQGPVCIIAKTTKGFRIPGCEEDYCGFHVFHGPEPGQATREIDIDTALAFIPEDVEIPSIPIHHLPRVTKEDSCAFEPVALLPQTTPVTSYDVQFSYLSLLEQQLGDRLYIFSSDYPPRSFVYSTGSFMLKQAHYYNVGLREQHMTALIQGLSQVRADAYFVIMCGDAFLYRHMDQINMLAQAGTRVTLYSVQAGLSGAQNGSTHQSSGQPGAILLMPGIVCEEPCTAEDFIEASNRALIYKGPTYIRMQKLLVPWNFGGSRKGSFEVVRFSPHAKGTIIASGKMALLAHRACVSLLKQNVEWNFINLTTLSCVRGLGEWILSKKPLYLYYNGAPKVLMSAVAEEVFGMNMPPSLVEARGFEFGVTGSIEELLRHFELDSKSIAEFLLAYHKVEAA